MIERNLPDKTMRTRSGFLTLLLAAIALAGCSGGSGLNLGGPKKKEPDVIVDSNTYPANYRRQIVVMLQTLLTNRADFIGTLIAPPTLKPVADSSYPHYVVCLQFNDPEGPKTKVVIYLGGEPQQYIDATPEQCAGAAYQPFTELQASLPHK
jgi:hypothetical protein